MDITIGFIFVTVLWQLRAEQDPIKKEERKAKLMRETIPFYLQKFENIVGDNNGYSVGNDVSLTILICSFFNWKMFCKEFVVFTLDSKDYILIYFQFYRSVLKLKS